MKKFFAAVSATLVLASAVVFAAPPQFDTPYIGNAYRKTFHKRDCSSVLQMNVANQVPLNSVQEALDAGYHPCGNCKPCPPPPGRTPPPKGTFDD